MITFAESSALVAELVGEPGAPELRGDVAISALARIEVASALERRRREGADAEALDVAQAAFEERYAAGDRAGGFAAIVPVSEPVSNLALQVLGRHPLRSLDAVQLASALIVRDAAGTPVALAALDDRLRRASGAEGFALLPA